MEFKYAITGHTRGIGHKLYERLRPNIIGFSRSTGYDIRTSEGRQRIIQESSECNIFINNAANLVDMSQVELFIELFDAWKNLDKTIINVGSTITDQLILLPHQIHLLKYQSQKILLKTISARFNLLSKSCKVRYRTFGYVHTESIRKAYQDITINDKFITEDEAVNIILSP